MSRLAERHDPQPFRVDEEAAKRSTFGGFVASGWHTVATTMRLLVENLVADSFVELDAVAEEIRR